MKKRTIILLIAGIILFVSATILIKIMFFSSIKTVETCSFYTGDLPSIEYQAPEWPKCHKVKVKAEPLLVCQQNNGHPIYDKYPVSGPIYIPAEAKYLGCKYD